MLTLNKRFPLHTTALTGLPWMVRRASTAGTMQGKPNFDGEDPRRIEQTVRDLMRENARLRSQLDRIASVFGSESVKVPCEIHQLSLSEFKRMYPQVYLALARLLTHSKSIKTVARHYGIPSDGKDSFDVLRRIETSLTPGLLPLLFCLSEAIGDDEDFKGATGLIIDSIREYNVTPRDE